jgi:hypothetical protein
LLAVAAWSKEPCKGTDGSKASKIDGIIKVRWLSDAVLVRRWFNLVAAVIVGPSVSPVLHNLTDLPPFLLYLLL